MLEARRLVGTHDILFVTLDTLRYDVAAERYAAGRTPHLAAVLPAGGWEKRHSPGNFTFAAHAAFFAGFFPTPARPGRAGLAHEQLNAPAGSEQAEQEGPQTEVEAVGEADHRYRRRAVLPAVPQPERHGEQKERPRVGTQAPAAPPPDGPPASTFVLYPVVCRHAPLP